MLARRSPAFLLTASLAAASVPACSLFVDLDGLSNGQGGAGGGGGAGAGAPGGSGGGTEVATSAGVGGGHVFFEDDDLDGEFGAGTFEGTEYSQETAVQLAGVASGTFTSRVFDAGSPATWLSLGWTPRGPYSKPLPNDGVAESYDQGAADMNENVLLLHMDGAGSVNAGDKLLDGSGLGYYATAAGSSFLFTDGRFGQAIADTAGNYVYVSTGVSPALAFGTADFTWSLWVRTVEDCGGNKVHLGVDDGDADTPHLWLGCTDSGESSCPPGAAGGRAGGTFKSNHNTGDTKMLCGTSRINDGAWHHLAVVKKGQPNVTMTLYVDGVAEDTAQTTWASPIQYTTSPQFAFGAFSEGTYQAEGTFDEVAIWRRALSAAEVAAIHRRAALRVGFQVRGCASEGCADAPKFVGPGSDPARVYVAPPVPGSFAQVSLDAVTESGEKEARYLQYRVLFESDALPAVPGLWTVEVEGERL